MNEDYILEILLRVVLLKTKRIDILIPCPYARILNIRTIETLKPIKMPNNAYLENFLGNDNINETNKSKN